MLSLDIPETGDCGGSDARNWSRFEIQDGDRIRIFPIAPYNQDAIYLDGHVIRPGRYSYRENMRVTDVIASYKDLLPEPATNYAEIIRLNAPDFHPTVESFDLADALANPVAGAAAASDGYGRIFSRFDFENPPTVSVWGDVRAPGTYRTSGQIRLGDAVHLAGGLAPDAQKEDAQVFRYLPDGKFKIFSVNLEPGARRRSDREYCAAAARPAADSPQSGRGGSGHCLRSRRSGAGPGRYPLTTNMTVADLIRVGGGLKPSADTEHRRPDTFSVSAIRLAADGAARIDFDFQRAFQGIQKRRSLFTTATCLRFASCRVGTIWGPRSRVKGEVKNPGTYGIRPGEKLSSILERAGGFQPDAYPYGAVLRRVQVRELEAQRARPNDSARER